MKRPESLQNLISSLSEEDIQSDVATSPSSKAVIYIDDNDQPAARFTEHECQLLFSSNDTVDRLLDALGNPDVVSLFMSNLDLPQAVLDYVERRFSSVDDCIDDEDDE